MTANKTINERYAKISGRIPIENKLELGEDYTIVVKGGVVKREELDNQDGTINVVFVLKPIEAEIND